MNSHTPILFSIGSLEVLENNVKGLGSISFLDQLDGIIRSLPLIVQLNKKLYPTIGLEMVRVGEKQKNIYVELNEVGINRISARPHKIESDPNGIIWIKYKNLKRSNIFLRVMSMRETLINHFFRINMCL